MSWKKDMDRYMSNKYVNTKRHSENMDIYRHEDKKTINQEKKDMKWQQNKTWTRRMKKQIQMV